MKSWIETYRAYRKRTSWKVKLRQYQSFQNNLCPRNLQEGDLYGHQKAIRIALRNNIIAINLEQLLLRQC